MSHTHSLFSVQLVELTNCSPDAAIIALHDSNNDLDSAIVALLDGETEVSLSLITLHHLTT